MNLAVAALEEEGSKRATGSPRARDERKEREDRDPECEDLRAKDEGRVEEGRNLRRDQGGGEPRVQRACCLLANYKTQFKRASRKRAK